MGYNRCQAVDGRLSPQRGEVTRMTKYEWISILLSAGSFIVSVLNYLK